MERAWIARCDVSGSGALCFGTIEWALRGKKHIHFDHACQMYQVEGASVLDRLIDVSCLDIGAALQSINQWSYLAGVDFGDDVDIEGGARSTVCDTGDRAPKIGG